MFNAGAFNRTAFNWSANVIRRDAISLRATFGAAAALRTQKPVLRHSFLINGLDMRERFGLIVSSFQDVLKPALRPRKVEIPERDGLYDFGAKYYGEREITVHCASVSLTREECRELAHVVSGKVQIVRWDEPDKYYTGRIYEPVDIERIVGQAKRFALVFICDPFACGETMDDGFDARIHYKGTARAPAVLTLTNTGKTSVSNIRIRMRRRV